MGAANKVICPLILVGSALAFYFMFRPPERSADYNRWVKNNTKVQWLQAYILPDNIALDASALKSMIKNASPYHLGHDRRIDTKDLVIQTATGQLSVKCIQFNNAPQALVIDVPDIGYYLVSDEVSFLADEDTFQ